MSGGIVGEVTTGQGLQRTGEPETRGAEGEYRGRKVVHRIDVRSLIAEAAEEISFSFSERVEKTLPGRKIIPKSGRMTRAMERARDHLARLPDLENTERLQEFLELLKSRGEWTLPGILRDARSFFRDVSHRHAGLSFAREMLEGEEGFEALRDGVGKALGTLEADWGPEIRAGFNVSGVAREYAAGGLGDVQRLRDFYRETVLGYGDLAGAYRTVVETYGDTDLPRAVSFLIKAAGVELQSLGPSISKIELKRIVDELYQLEVLGNLHANCGELVERMRSRFGPRPAGGARELLGLLMGLVRDPRPERDRVAAVVRSMGIAGVEARIGFLRELRTLVWEIPPKACGDGEARRKLLEGVEAALDEEIRREEEDSAWTG